LSAEKRVAVEAVGAVLHCQPGHRFVELGDACYQPGHVALEVLPYSVVFCLVFLKPRAVVVGRHVAEEL